MQFHFLCCDKGLCVPHSVDRDTDMLVTRCCCCYSKGQDTLPSDSWFESKCRTLGIPHDAHHQNIKLDQWGSQVGNNIA